jgi:hypothetical protein
MTFRYPLLLILMLLAACRQRSPDSGRTLEGSPADSVVTGAGNSLTAEPGVEFEAPRLIPGMLAMLEIIDERKGRVDEGTAAGYRQAAGSLVDAMLSDLYRVGIGDDGSFRALGDSAVTLVGGGAGEAPEAKPEEVLRSAGMMRRLIEMYQRQMKEVQD